MKLLESQQSVNNSSDFSTAMEDKPSSMEGVEIKPMDVLCGRGKNSFNHVGNRKFRDIVGEAIPGYVAATSRATKSEIVTSIVRLVRESGGRFLKRDGSRKVWYVLNYTQSKEKAGHAIRDATITDDSKKQRAHKRKLMRAAAAGSSSPPSNLNLKTVGVVTPDSATSTMTVTEEAHQAEREKLARERVERAQAEFWSKDLTTDVKSLDDTSSFHPVECLSSMLMAHFPEKLFPEDTPSSASFEPLPIDDPFNSYIDQLLGPLTELTDISAADF